MDEEIKHIWEVKEGDLLRIYLEDKKQTFLVKAMKEPLGGLPMIFGQSVDGTEPKTITIAVFKNAVKN